jgi:hypothetical protein
MGSCARYGTSDGLYAHIMSLGGDMYIILARHLAIYCSSPSSFRIIFITVS